MQQSQLEPVVCHVPINGLARSPFQLPLRFVVEELAERSDVASPVALTEDVVLVEIESDRSLRPS